MATRSRAITHYEPSLVESGYRLGRRLFARRPFVIPSVNNFTVGPSGPDSVVHGTLPGVGCLHPLRSRCSNPVVRDESVAPRIPSLLRTSGPATIFGEVPKRVVDPIERCSVRALTHIREKSIEHFPSIADGNTSPAVVLEILIVRVRTSGNHCLPRYVRSSFAHAVQGLSRSLEVSARFGVAAKEVPTLHNDYSATRTQALPVRIAIGMTESENGKFVEFLTSKVSALWHFRHLENFTIERVWQAVVKLLFGSYPSHATYCTTEASK